MPLHRLYQYAHMALLLEGNNTDWHTGATTPEQEHAHINNLIAACLSKKSTP